MKITELIKKYELMLENGETRFTYEGKTYDTQIRLNILKRKLEVENTVKQTISETAVYNHDYCWNVKGLKKKIPVFDHNTYEYTWKESTLEEIAKMPKYADIKIYVPMVKQYVVLERALDALQYYEDINNVNPTEVKGRKLDKLNHSIFKAIDSRSQLRIEQSKLTHQYAMHCLKAAVNERITRLTDLSDEWKLRLGIPIKYDTDNVVIAWYNLKNSWYCGVESAAKLDGINPEYDCITYAPGYDWVAYRLKEYEQQYNCTPFWDAIVIDDVAKYVLTRRAFNELVIIAEYYKTLCRYDDHKYDLTDKVYYHSKDGTRTLELTSYTAGVIGDELLEEYTQDTTRDWQYQGTDACLDEDIIDDYLGEEVC